jgi:hypothetical protein
VRFQVSANDTKRPRGDPEGIAAGSDSLVHSGIREIRPEFD